MELIDLFLSIEKKYRLNEKSIGELYYWRLYRFFLFSELDVIANKVDVAHKEKSGVGNSIGKGFKVIYYSFFKKSSTKKQYNYFIINHPRRMLSNEKFECIYSSEIASNLEKSIMYERVYDHKQPITEKNIIYGDRIALVSNIKTRISSFFKGKEYKKIEDRIYLDVHEALKELCNELKIGDNYVSRFETELINNYFKCFYKLKYYNGLIQRISPEIVIEVVSYSSDCMIINRICKRLNIPTIELQHGTMDSNHIAYNYGENKKIEELPDYEFVFSDYWKKVTVVPIRNENIIPVGFPHFEKGIKEVQKKTSEKKNKAICFISQGPIGEQLSKLALELSKLIDGSEWVIYYKLHPGEISDWRKKYSYLLNTSIIVIENDEMSLYEVFANSQIQVGVYSTALFEGMGFGLKTLIYKIYMSEVFQKCCEMGFSKYISGANDIIDEMNMPNQIKTEGEFWKKDSLYNILSAIKKIESGEENV